MRAFDFVNFHTLPILSKAAKMLQLGFKTAGNNVKKSSGAGLPGKRNSVCRRNEPGRSRR